VAISSQFTRLVEVSEIKLNQNIIIFKKLSSWKKQLKILIQIIQQPSFPVWGFAIKEKTESLKG